MDLTKIKERLELRQVFLFPEDGEEVSPFDVITVKDYEQMIAEIERLAAENAALNHRCEDYANDYAELMRRREQAKEMQGLLQVCEDALEEICAERRGGTHPVVIASGALGSLRAPAP